MPVTDKELESAYLVDLFGMHTPDWDKIKEIAKGYGIKDLSEKKTERIADRIVEHLKKVNEPVIKHLQKHNATGGPVHGVYY